MTRHLRRRERVSTTGSLLSVLFSLRPDFAVRAFQGNAVLRWEWRPGSALFVVWQHGREGFDEHGRFGVGRGLGDLLNDRPTNALLVKLSYWLG